MSSSDTLVFFSLRAIHSGSFLVKFQWQNIIFDLSKACILTNHNELHMCLLKFG